MVKIELMSPPSAEQLLREALEMPFPGWDLSMLGTVHPRKPPPRSFERIVDDEAGRAASMLDMGTGRSEWLSNRRHTAGTVGTERWPPNAPVLALGVDLSRSQ